jgi:hypothetical protein
VTALKKPSGSHLVPRANVEVYGGQGGSAGVMAMGHIRKKMSRGGRFLYAQVPFS